jgi:hypothetical protein
MTFLVSGQIDYFTNTLSESVVDREFVASSVKQPLIVKPRPSERNLKTIFIQDLGDARVSLRRPLPMVVESWGAKTSVYSPDTGDFSVAIDEGAALDELRSSVVDLYFLLKDEQANLGPLPLRHWNFLRSVIDEI